ncbi:hypothetical protein DY000_02014880 [Brassica cretica]|uniref:Malectin-like domain-containing protein n=1 Tax=Brassica cretica TaxID=69181 RepID=A0ABQ7D976_BRACR|nr:hypothetical protein DY000_02014880 [Brassica cretica]
MLASQWRGPSWIFPLLSHNPLHLTGVFSGSNPTSHIKLRFDLEKRNSYSVQIYMHHKSNQTLRNINIFAGLFRG